MKLLTGGAQGGGYAWHQVALQMAGRCIQDQGWPGLSAELSSDLQGLMRRIGPALYRHRRVTVRDQDQQRFNRPVFTSRLVDHLAGFPQSSRQGGCAANRQAIQLLPDAHHAVRGRHHKLRIAVAKSDQADPFALQLSPCSEGRDGTEGG